jgi:hypothetical protein
MNAACKVVLVLLVALMAACGSSSSSGSSADDPNTRTGGQALVEGDSDVGAGQQVTMSEVQADGSLRLLEESVTDADGRYSALVGHGGNDILVAVEGAGSVLVSHARLTGGADILLAPISAETTVEAMVFVRAVETGVWNENSTVEGLRDFVSAEFAAEMIASGQAEAAADDYAAAATAHMTAWQEMLASDAIGADEEAQRLFSEGHAAAQVEYDAALDAASDSEAAAEAATAYAVRAELAAEAAGLSAEDTALAAEAAAWTSFSTLSQLEGDLQGQALADAHTQLAARSVAEAELHVAALGGDVDAITEAGAALEAELATAAAEGEDAARTIEAAWDTYQDALAAEFENALAAHVGLGSEFILAELQIAITVATDALLTSLDALASAEDSLAAANIAVDAFSSFQLDLLAGALAETLTALGMSQAEADAALELYAMMAIH